MIGCRCEVCLSENPKNHRFRPSILVRKDDFHILVDTTPELRLQALTFDIRRVDVVLMTHTHADHIFGMDDLRRFNDLRNADIPVYGTENVLADIRRIYEYIFKQTQMGGGKPRLTLHPLESEHWLGGIRVEPLSVLHGRLPITSYRFEHFPSQDFPSQKSSAAYVTDVSKIPEATWNRLFDLDLLILDAVRFDPHPTHLGLYQALDIIAELQPKQALITHISHHFEHESVNNLLPPNVRLAYDGQKITF